MDQDCAHQAGKPRCNTATGACQAAPCECPAVAVGRPPKHGEWTPAQCIEHMKQCTGDTHTICAGKLDKVNVQPADVTDFCSCCHATADKGVVDKWLCDFVNSQGGC